jgi:NAD dependent epimerase/dehydratase family enzyme
VFLNALENDEMIGIYNAVSTDYQTNKSFTSIAAEVMQRPYFLPNVPAFILRIAFGELSDTFLKGQKVYPQRLINKQFSFEFETLESAIKDLTK